MKNILFFLIILSLPSCNTIKGENTEETENPVKEEVLINGNKKLILFFDPTIYDKQENFKIKRINDIISDEILYSTNLCHNKELFFWIIQDQMVNKSEELSITFKLDLKQSHVEKQFPILGDCLSKIDSIISSSWHRKHFEKHIINTPTSSIIESLYIVNSKYELDENTEVVFISDMLQESKEYNMNLESVNSKDEIAEKFNQIKNQLSSTDITFDYSKIKSLTIYQTTSNKITTIEKLQTIKSCWINFFNEVLKIDESKIIYETNI